ncbi:MAG: hypothetical protein P9F19_17175, partial [Candidatus Contendobacter sp.]|nr:hypothetical protein [Candidatus Contendobacter sp.]MDG4559100.1 hypothetical protein [Candidatus Contendobacter sp.]
GGGRDFEEFVGRRMDPKLIDRMFDFRRMQYLQTVKIESLGVWLALARLFNSKSVLNELGQIIEGLLMHRPSFRTRLSALPIASLPDLRWLAEQNKSEKLQLFVDKLT